MSNHYYRQKAYFRDELQIYNQLIIIIHRFTFKEINDMADHNARLKNMLDVEFIFRKTYQKIFKIL